jgi:hypothetical protein
MHYIAIAIFDSENKSLKDKVDKIHSEVDKELYELSIKSIDKNLDEITDLYNQAPNEVLGIDALISVFEKKLEKPLNKLIDKEFDSYAIRDVLSVNKRLNDFLNNDFDRFPDAILTPNCEWIKEDWSNDEKEEIRLSNEWERTVINILNKYKDTGIIVEINCDS